MSGVTPKIFTDEEKAAAQARIVELMCDGKTLSAICRDEPGMPHRQRVYEWIDADPEFAKVMDRAREIGCDALADQEVEIADDGRNDWMRDNDPDNPGWKMNGEHVQRSKLRIWARQELRKKWHPKKYGDKVTAEHTGPGGGPLQHMQVTFVDGPGE